MTSRDCAVANALLLMSKAKRRMLMRTVLEKDPSYYQGMIDLEWEVFSFLDSNTLIPQEDSDMKDDTSWFVSGRIASIESDRLDSDMFWVRVELAGDNEPGDIVGEIFNEPEVLEMGFSKARVAGLFEHIGQSCKICLVPESA